MLYGEERKKQIIELVNQNGRASVQDLSASFQVSESTIRRDLKELEEERKIKRAHGGAVSLQSVNFEPSVTEKEVRYKSEKRAIAQLAATFIEDGDTILIDSGTTTIHLIPELKSFTDITVVTNSLLIAQELQLNEGIDVIVLGGSLRRETQSLVGPVTNKALHMIRVDKGFIATNGLDLEEGLTTPNLIEAETKYHMMQAAKQVLVLTDHSKVGKVSFAKVAGLQDIDACITDSGVPNHMVQQLEEQGVDMHIVNAIGEGTT